MNIKKGVTAETEMAKDPFFLHSFLNLTHSNEGSLTLLMIE